MSTGSVKMLAQPASVLKNLIDSTARRQKCIPNADFSCSVGRWLAFAHVFDFYFQFQFLCILITDRNRTQCRVL